MQATLKLKLLKPNLKPIHRKEKGYYKELKLLYIFNDSIYEAATIRLYRTLNKYYACFWLYNTHSTFEQRQCSGSGEAGGYGYCKESCAINNAIKYSGIILDSEVTSQRQAEEALLAIGDALGVRGCYISISHA